MAYITKRGDSYFAQVRKQGISKSKSFSTKTQALNWATQIESQVITGTLNTPSGKTFADAIERYKIEVSPTKRGERWEVIRLNAWLRLPFVHYKLSDVTTPLLANWRDERLKTVQSSTVNRELNLMSALFEQCRREWQWIKVNPVHDVKRPANPQHRERIFTNAERDALCVELGLIEPYLVETKQQIIAAAFLFALETAMRREEITGLEWSRIDLQRRFLSLPLTKNGDARQVPLSKRAIELLELLKAYDKPFPVDKDVLSTLFRRACLNAKVENAHFHDARATALTRLSKKLNVLELARMVGHRDIRSLQVYYRETAQELALKLD
jgi:integrase